MIAAGCNQKSPTDNAAVHYVGMTGRVVLNGVSTRPEVVKPSSEGVVVELIGTTNAAVTDSTGLWKIPRVLAGTYTLRFTKPGFDTVFINGVVYNGSDSLYVGWLVTDSTGTQRTSDKVMLVELPAKVSLSLVNPEITLNRVAKDDGHGSFYYDTSYSVSGIVKMNIDFERTDVTLKRGLDIRFMLSPKPVLEAFDYPPDSTLPYGGAGSWMRIINFNPGSVSQDGSYNLSKALSMPIEHYLQIHGIAKSNIDKLYLHAYPIWGHYDKYFSYGTNGKTFYVTVLDRYMRGATVTARMLLR